MAAKLILKDTKAPLLFFRSQLLAVAAVSKTTSPNPQLIQSIQPSNQNPLPHLSDLRHYLYQPPSPLLNGLGLGLAETSDSTLGRLQARGSDDDETRGSDDDEEYDSGVEMTDDEDDDVIDTDYESDEDYDT